MKGGAAVRPALRVHPERLGPALGAPLPAELCRRLLASARLAPRVAELLESRLPLPHAATGQTLAGSSRLAVLEPAALAEAMRLAACVWHGRAMTSFILAAPRAALVNLLGEAAYDFAMANGDLAVEAATDATLEDLAAAVMREAAAIFRVWLDGLPEPLRLRVRLGLPLAGEPACDVSERHHDHAPAILDRLAERMCGHGV